MTLALYELETRKEHNKLPLSPECATAILNELIRKPDTNGPDIPRIWQEIIDVYNKHYSMPVELPKKRPRRKGARPMGWPAGVSRQEFKVWKEEQLAKGKTEGLNPHEYRRHLQRHN